MRADEGKVIRGNLIVARRNPTTLLDPVEERFDTIPAAVEITAKADQVVAIAFWRDVGSCAFLHGELSEIAMTANDVLRAAGRSSDQRGGASLI